MIAAAGLVKVAARPVPAYVPMLPKLGSFQKIKIKKGERNEEGRKRRSKN